MAQSKDNRPWKFYEDHDIQSALMGDFRSIRERNIRILGVSATPFSEITGDQKVHAGEWTSPEGQDVSLETKIVFPMTPGEGYLGIQEFLDRGCLKFEAEPISEKKNKYEHISKVLAENRRKYNRGYVVIRTQAKAEETLIRHLAKQYNYRYKSRFGGTKGTLKLMKKRPKKATIIHICGRFRMGQVIPKKFIKMVYEQSANPNADTILQGLPGRMCGYTSEGAHLNVDIYVSKKSEDSIIQYAKSWTSNEPSTLTGITKAMNLKLSRNRSKSIIHKDKSGVEWIETIPIRFSLRDVIHGTNDHAFGSTKLYEMIELLNDPSVGCDTPDRAAILETMEEQERIIDPRNKKKLHIHNGQNTASQEKQDRLQDAVLMNKRLNLSTNVKDVKKWETEKLHSFSLLGTGRLGDPVYLMGMIRYDANNSSHVDNDPSLAEVDVKCNFNPNAFQREDGLVTTANGGQLIPFPWETASDPEKFKDELVKAIRRTQEGDPTYIPNCQSSISSMHDAKSKQYKGINFSKDVYTKESLEELKREIERDCQVTLTFTPPGRGRARAGFFKHASINW